jgi:cytochrome c oxidase subunit 3
MHPQKFALLVGCASMMMMFVAFTSALIVRQAQGNWLEFQMPSIFYTSTVVILASSVTLHLA